MQAFAALSTALIAVVTAVVGVRLLLVARRTRQLPELGFGAAFLGGSLGTAVGQLGQRLLWGNAGAFGAWMNALCFGLNAAATALLFVVIWRIFRPRAAWAKGIAVLGCATVLVGYGLRIASGEFAGAALETPGMLVFMLARTGLYVWSAFEGLRYAGLLRKRVVLGLADPLAANQIFLWGVSGVAMVGVVLTIFASVFVLHRHPLEIGAAVAIITVLALALSVTMWCAFFPPEALRQRITGSPTRAG